MSYDERRVNRWYFGAIASSIAASIVHPLDLVKVLIQTEKGKFSVPEMTVKIVREQGVLALYSGISAALLRQYTYSLARFGVYVKGSEYFDSKSMTGKVVLSAFSGAFGGLVGCPGDMLNVRLQNDVKLPPEKRRNYKHVFDGLVRVCREEGWRKLFNGGTVTSIRGCLMNVGQIAFYEQTKNVLLNSGMPPKVHTYIFASSIAAVVATTLTQPIDVVKTRRMNAEPGAYSGVMDIIIKTGKEGPTAFMKGYVPALVRLGPATVILFVTLEMMRTYFGYIPEAKVKESKYIFDKTGKQMSRP